MPRPMLLRQARINSTTVLDPNKAKHLNSAEGLEKRAKSRLVKQAYLTGNLRYKLLPHQEKMYDIIKSTKPGKKCILNCSRRYGKSTVLCIVAIEQCVSKPNSVVIFLSLSSKQSRQIIEPILHTMTADIPTAMKPQWNQNAGTYCFANGSRIVLGSSTDGNEESLRGLTGHLIIVDEAASIVNLKYIIDSILLPATLTTEASLIIASTPSISPDSYFTEICRIAETEGSYACFDVYQNTSLKPNVIEQFCKESGGRNSTTWQREYLCQFVTETSSVVIPEWQQIFEYLPVKDDNYLYYHKYISLDIGVVDLTAIVFGYYDFRNARLVIEDEVVINGTEVTTARINELVRAKEAELWQGKEPYKRIADNNNLILLQDLGSVHNLFFTPTGKDSQEAMTNEVRMLVSAGKLIVNPKCTQTIGCLRYAVWNNKRNSFARSAAYGHYDCLAALIYLVRNLDKYTNPIPSVFDPYNMRGYSEEPNLTPNGQLIKKVFSTPI